MGQNGWDKFFFVPSLADFDFERYADYVLHILCTQGSMDFTVRSVSYHLAPGDYAVVTCASLLTRYSESDDFRALIMGLSGPFASSWSIRCNYNVIAYLSLLERPVMKFSEEEYVQFRTDLDRLRARLAGSENHLFRERLLGALLAAHMFDLYDRHVREQGIRQLSDQGMILLRHFVELLSRGDYHCRRDLDYYAASLCVTPQYLSKICRQISGHPASHWIDHFFFQETIHLLNKKDLSLSEIAERMGFSSLSHLNQYVRRQTGLSPTEYRGNLRDE